jgi:hypothetical protein
MLNRLGFLSLSPMGSTKVFASLGAHHGMLKINLRLTSRRFSSRLITVDFRNQFLSLSLPSNGLNLAFVLLLNLRRTQSHSGKLKHAASRH